MDHHNHHHHSDLRGFRLLLSVVLNLGITIAQIIGGIVSGSLALLSDALHNFSDVMSLIISYGAHRLSRRPYDFARTFGFKRSEILAALFNASLLIVVSLYLIVESVQRLLAPEPIDSLWVMGLASLGIIVNGFSAYLLHHDSHHNLNIRSACLHLIGDLLTSVAVLFGGVLIYLFGWYWIDPILSLIISLYLIRSAVSIVSESAGMLMQFAPAHVSVESVIEKASLLPQIESIHHIHLWQLDDQNVFLEGRLNFHDDIHISEANAIARSLSEELKKSGITHTTFEYEVGNTGNLSVAEHC